MAFTSHKVSAIKELDQEVSVNQSHDKTLTQWTNVTTSFSSQAGDTSGTYYVSIFTKAWLIHTVADDCGDDTLMQVFERLAKEEMNSPDWDSLTAVDETFASAHPPVKELVVMRDNMVPAPTQVDDEVKFAGAWTAETKALDEDRLAQAVEEHSSSTERG